MAVAKTKPTKTNIEKKEKQPNSKKKKITLITSIICAVVLIVTSIVSIVLITRKEWNLSPNSAINYNNHTNMRIVSPANNVSIYNTSKPTYYSNGTVFIENVDTDTYGVYSYIENKAIIPTDYLFDNIIPTPLINQDGELDKTIFKVKNKFGEISDIISFYDDKGNNLNLTEYNEDEKQNYGFIKQRKLSVSEKRKGVKVSVKNKFIDEKIKIKDIDYVESYTRNGIYNYELWKLTTNENIEYLNLYKVEDNERILVQTLNNITGNNIELSNSNINTVFLKDGTPAFYVSETITNLSSNKLLRISVYDIELNEIGNYDFSDENLSASFIVGNKLFVQFITPASEDDYDFSKIHQSSFSTTITYFKSETYSINLKNGKTKQEKFNYLISGMNADFNPETVLVYAQKFEDNILKDTEILLINDKLQVKKISYNIDTITQINKDRYLVKNTQGYYIINEDYDLICSLGKSSNINITKNSVILADYTTGYSYVCSLDGVVVKKYKSDDLIFINDDKYYIVKVETEKQDGTYNELYLETLGVRDETPLYSQKASTETYFYNNQEYVAFDRQIFSDGISIITRVRKNGELFTYEFYNIDGVKLLQLDNFTTSDRTLNYWNYSNEDYALLYISTNVGGIGYTIVVDK